MSILWAIVNKGMCARIVCSTGYLGHCCLQGQELTAALTISKHRILCSSLPQHLVGAPREEYQAILRFMRGTMPGFP
ncbi:hypothetical protein NQZ68_004991 [Dissostichus eleginoides]|nr:hypothetical protein NQZ68_004991 [Dissostichus eleginoides]